ncbi:MAG TPA: hypothetical protein VMW63_01980 [Methanoregulaceae archaeon]|nr:hypothetical protein [Methanoregulaceae archaeon]
MNSGIVEMYLEKWTKDLEGDAAIISVYSHVRDIPYAAISGLSDPWNGPELMLAIGRGSCTPKHNLLARMFEIMGVNIIFSSFKFSWNNPLIAYPDSLKKIVADLPPVYHMALRAYIHGTSCLVDATWDLPLKKAGFPVTTCWDGISDCILAVTPLQEKGSAKEVLHDSMKKRDEYYRARATEYTVEQVVALNLFYQNLNAWLDDVRVSSAV